MANTRVVEAVTGAMMDMLSSQQAAEDFDGADLQFAVYQAEDFQQPMEAGVSLFLYRISADAAQRATPLREPRSGLRTRPHLPLSLHFLLTAWAPGPAMQHHIAGWMMRAIEETPILTADQMNDCCPGSFEPGEQASLVLDELTSAEILHIWQAAGGAGYQISLPFAARITG